jgi:ribonucleoside-diphosphate reductase alpha chain
MNSKLMDYFNGDELAAEVWTSKYMYQDEVTPDDTHFRLAREFARIERKYLPSEMPKDLSEYGRKRIKELQCLSAEQTERYFYDFLQGFKYIIPAGSVMEASGTNKIQSLANCFVGKIPNDSVEEIYFSSLSMAQLGKRRGGAGVDLSLLRPNGSSLNNAAKISSGVVSWMDVYDSTGKTIGQNNRKMAMIISLDVRHPDIEEFISCKQQLNSINNANISVKLHDDFLQAVNNDKDYFLRFPCDAEFVNLNLNAENNDIFEYNKLYCYSKGMYFKKVRAKELWNKIFTNARNHAEPGIFNWDKIINYDPTSVYPELSPVTTNPCSELPLSEYDSCRLIHVNMFGLVINPFKKRQAYFDENAAYKIFYECQCMADNLVDLEIEAIDRILEKIKPGYKLLLSDNGTYNGIIYSESDEFKLWWKVREIALKGRRTGCGITGYADFCAAMGVPYGEWITFKVFRIKMQAELDATIDMAILRGAFPLWDGTKEYPLSLGSYGNEWYKFAWFEFPEQIKRMVKYGRRNAGLSTVAPTGTVSIMTQTASGIEPLFKPYYIRRKILPNDAEKFDFQDVNGKKYSEHVVVHPKLAVWLREGNFTYHKLEENCTAEDWQKVYEMSPYYKQSAEDIMSEKRVMVQAEIQKYISAAISSTVNLPETATVEDVEKIYRMAFEKGCKGITVYREGSRAGILVDAKKKNQECFCYEDAIKRPKLVNCDIHIITALKKRWLVLVGTVDGKPYEIFAIPFEDNESFFKDADFKKYKNVKFCIVKKKKLKYSLINCVTQEVFIDDIVSLMSNDDERTDTKQISLQLRHKIHPKWIVRATDKKFGLISSFEKAIARVLKKYINDGEECGSLCEICSSRMVYENGCTVCKSCGNDRCG